MMPGKRFAVAIPFLTGRCLQRQIARVAKRKYRVQVCKIAVLSRQDFCSNRGFQRDWLNSVERRPCSRENCAEANRCCAFDAACVSGDTQPLGVKIPRYAAFRFGGVRGRHGHFEGSEFRAMTLSEVAMCRFHALLALPPRRRTIIERLEQERAAPSPSGEIDRPDTTLVKW